MATPEKVKETADKIDAKLDEVKPAVDGFFKKNAKVIIIVAVAILAIGIVAVVSGVGA